MKTISSAATAPSASCWTAAPTRTSRRVPPSKPRIRSMSRSTAAASSWCRPRPASVTPATADYRSTIRASWSRRTAMRCSAPTDRSYSSRPTMTSAIAADGNITVVEGINRTNSVRGKLRLVSFARRAAASQGRLQPLFGRQRRAAQPDTASRVRQGFVEKSNVNSVAEMSRMIEVTRTYTQIANMLQQQSDLHKAAIDKLADVPALRKLIHARALYRRDRNGGPGTQRSGDLQQHRELAHHRLQEAARGVPGSALRPCAPGRRAGIGPGHHPAGRRRHRRRRQDRRHAAR